MNLSSNIPDAVLQERLSAQAPNTCCSLIYTVSWYMYTVSWNMYSLSWNIYNKLAYVFSKLDMYSKFEYIH